MMISLFPVINLVVFTNPATMSRIGIHSLSGPSRPEILILTNGWIPFQVLEYGKEGYFWLFDIVNEKYLTLDVQSSKKNIILDDLEDDLYNQLWYWEGQYIHNVQLFSRVLSTETNEDPKAGAGLVGSTKKDDWMDVQKWKMIDGKLMLASNDQLLVTGSETGSVTLQGKGTGSQDFDKRVTDIGKSIGKFCGNDRPSDFQSRGNEVIVLHYEAGNNDDSFALDWIANEDVCGEEMTGPEGVIMSPNFPQPYDSGQGSTDNGSADI